MTTTAYTTAAGQAREFRSVLTNKDLVEAAADGYATIEGYHDVPGHARLVDVTWTSETFEPGQPVRKVMRTNRATARKLGLPA
jgi:hypothetical protein